MEVLIKFAVFIYSLGQIGTDESICTSYYSQSSGYSYSCGTWGWSRCHGTRYHQRENKFCCPGYRYYPNCYPICNGRTVLNYACNEQYTSDSIKYFGGESRDRGGGTCSSPDYCTGCEDGFYQHGGRCLICPNIANCNHRRCNTPNDNHCEYCHYEIKSKLTWRGYTRHYDGEMKQCKKACSWRSDSTRCFPGNCTDEIVETCNCTSGFGGNQCDTITEEPSILYAEIKLHNPVHAIVTTPLDPSDTGPQPVRFTNKNDLNEAEIQFHGKFEASGIPPSYDPSGENHYVTDFKYGIVFGQMTLEYSRGENSTVETFSCPATVDFPIRNNYVCSRTRINDSAVSIMSFDHSDRLVFKVDISNGGYLTYINRETTSYITTVLTGKTVSRSYTVQWDYITPYYSCYDILGINCTVPVIEQHDITEQNIISISWRQWNDDLSGIDGYEYEVFHLHPKGNVLKEDNKLLSSNRIPATEFQSKLNLTTPGMYSLILNAIDKAGNHKSTRSVFLYDNQSVVEKVPGTRIVVTESTIDTNYTWVTVDTNRLTVTWTGRFRNERHDIYKWCNEIEDSSHIDEVYDDRFGQRTVDWLTNVRGVVRFDINYTISGPDVKSSETYTNVPDILLEAEVLDVIWEDGQTLDISVKATDMIGKFTEDTTTIFKDTTAPEITRLWLTYGNKTELYVHRQEDFSSLSFEWDTFDYHSGIDSVHWRLYDNYTGSDVVHGNSHVTAQGDVSNMTLCEEKYQSSKRGPDCYCTLFHGCFHRHFQIQPVIVNGAGLIPGNDKGMHDSDYFIEVTIVNKAMLTSVLTTKITIDTIPPQKGTVHDGLYELHDIDYQQDFHLDFHWDGFFDPESGVQYYKYIISDYCWTKQDLIASTEGVETYDTVASYDATEEGRYYITVIAMNSANDASSAVCSDGVTITSEKPGVKNIVLDGARTKPRLVTDTGNIIWLIGEDLSRSLINDTSLCSTATTMVDDIQLFPQNENTDIDCTQFPSLDYTFLSVLPRSSKLSLSWDSSVADQLIYDYQIGLSSTKSNSAPDILPFRSTKHHRHFTINHPDLVEGTIFHIIIKAISKSGVEGIQNFGPIIIDSTPPTFSGSQIELKFENGTLLANWTGTAFTDVEDPFPLQYMFALGHDTEGTDVAPYQPLQHNEQCVTTEPPTCTVIDTASLGWFLHENHDYYLTIKVTNLAGLSTTQSSAVYTHNIQLPTAGIVYDIDPGNLKHLLLKDLIDIDFSVVHDVLATEWKGFYHPHLQLHYKVCIGSVKGCCDIASENNLDVSTNQFIFKNLSLSNLQKYFTTVEAFTTTGSVSKSSDGVTIINNKTGLSGITINDGPLCSDIIVLNASHHVREIVPSCEIDIDYQRSTTSLQSKWEIPNYLKHIVRSAYWSIDQRSTVAEVWFKFRDFSYIGSQSHVIVNELDLQPGLTYRFSIKLCADDVCFQVISSNGVTVISSNPVVGSMNVQLDTEKMRVTFAAMYDPDTEDRTEAFNAMETYEWAISDGQYVGGLYEKWNAINNIMKINTTHIYFDILMSGEIDLSKCKQINVKGINKAGVWSVISGDLKQCNVTVVDGQTDITPRIVIDAYGESDENENNNGIGKSIYPDKDTSWTQTDVDYTPYKNVLSAVWPTLRHSLYQWAVVEVKTNNAFTFYKKFTDIVISDPCSHPDMIQCGQTDKRYINAKFNKTEYLIHGRRYAICIHAPETLIQHEKWKESLDAVTTCSDGVTIDLTPPEPGNVWIGHDPQFSFQTTSSDIFITWDSFIDVEEAGYSSHSSGVSRYLVSVGSVVGGVDIIDNKNVGLTNHVTFHDLQLQNGHKYFVTVTAYDFVNRSAEIRSEPITIDTTPPEMSSKPITISGRLLSNLTEIEACWEGVFYDVQSGIYYYMWGIGSLPGQDDVIPFSKTLQHCDMSLEDRGYDIIEGYPYFITVKAFNRAHLSVSKSTLAYIYDITPPSTGHVYDWTKDTSTPEKKDIDYQTDMSQLSFFWEDFHDPHSIIKYYNVHIGTCPGCSDVISQHTVGIHTYFSLSNVNLEAGITYYSTVTACNTGNLCTSATSDGVVVDNSAPVPGVVQDGTDDHDIEYQSARNYLSAKWFGFADAQSEIKYYVIRAGSSPGSADIYPPKMLAISDLVLLTDLPVLLPFGRRIYTTIRAYNKAGLFSESTSNGFIIDISAPEIVEKPSLSSDLGSIVPGSTVLRSALRFRWNVQDTQSSIQRQYLSISSHLNGEFNATSLMVSGIIREYTMTCLDLHDGVTYYINLIVCNGAQICIETKSDGILVDTTPPTSGMFAVSTYHAANLQRHTPGWMSWSEYRLHISLLGFKDLHSGITKYFVSLGNNFMGDNLNKVPGSPMEYFHNDSSIHHLDEGPIQFIILSTQQLKNYDHIFISIWAVNKVGLKSPMIHHKFQLIPGGYLDLIRRCTAQTCLGHCVCSPRDKRCHLIGNACTDVSADNKDSLITVLDTIDLSGTNRDDIQFTPSNSFLSATWNIVKKQGLPPLWYEWGIGFTSSDSPEHVIDNSTETLWHHSGQIMEAAYCLPRGQRLSELLTYSVFVRVWYSSSKFAIFKSDGVTVLAQPIIIKNHRGSAVVEKIPLFWKSDVDFIKPGYLFTINWENVFSAKSGSIQKFNVYISSFKGGADLHKVDLDIEPSVYTVNISRLTMVPGVRYFSNVIARSYSGLQTVAYSDGIMVDSSPPVYGVIYDGLGLRDINYQNKSDIVAATWHGFTDTGSGIVRYSWCVGATQNDVCDILPIKNAGMHTSVSTRIQNPANNGKVLYSKLKAVDEVGYETDITISTGVAVDTTPPLPVVFSHALENLLVNPSFEETNGCFMDVEEVSGYSLCDNDNCNQPLSWIKDNCATTIKSDVNVAFDERSFIYLKGSIQQNIQKLVIDVLYRVSFVTSHTPISGAVISNIEGSVEFCNLEHAFQIFTKENESDITWHLHTFYFRANLDTSELKISNLNRNVGFLVDDVKIQKIDELSNSADEKAVHIHTVGLHRWTSIHASWNFVDLESPIVEYLWAIGNTKGNAEVQHFQSVGVYNFAYNYNVTLVHLSQIFVTVVAVNAADLRGIAYSTGFDIDLTPPVIAYVHDGAGDDIDGQTSNTISAYWDVSDSESKINFCELAVGFQPYGNELQSFKKTIELKSATVTFDEDIISQKTVYSTVRCHNNAGLLSTATSDGVTISEIPPSSENAVITMIPQSITEYSSGDNYQQDKTSIRMKWSGFVDQFGIMSFVVQFDGENIHLKNSVLDINKQVSYMVMTGLDLPASLYTASVAATGSMYIRSNKIYTNITVNTTNPAVKEGSRVTTIKKGNEITVSWSDCFTKPESLVYEVSAGTTQGGADVIQWQETTNTFITLQLTENLKSNSNLNLFLFIRAIGQNGAYSSMGDDISV